MFYHCKIIFSGIKIFIENYLFESFLSLQNHFLENSYPQKFY